MAVNTPSGAYYERTSGTFPATESFTVCLWCRWPSYTAFRSVVDLSNGNADQQNAVTFYLDGTDVRHYDARAGTVTDDVWFSSGTVAAGNWVFLATVITTAGHTRYFALPTSASLTSGSNTNAGARAALTTLRLGADISGTTWGGEIAGVKIWDAELTADEIAQERWTVSPRRFANLHAWHPFLIAETVDYGGSARALTVASGTPATLDAPPAGWGAGSLLHPLTPPASTTLAAGANAITLTPPAATLAPGASTLAAGANTITLAASAATVAPGPATLVAGANVIVLTPGVATLLPGSVTLGAGANVLTLTNPAATIAGVQQTLVAGANAILLTAPAATLIASAGIDPAILRGMSILAAGQRGGTITSAGSRGGTLSPGSTRRTL